MKNGYQRPIVSQTRICVSLSNLIEGLPTLLYSTSYLGISSLPSNRPPNERIYVEGREDIDQEKMMIHKDNNAPNFATEIESRDASNRRRCAMAPS